MPIRLKILLASLLLATVTVMLGVYGLNAQRQLGALAIQTFNDAFMSVSFVRSAETHFERLRGLYAAAPEPGSDATQSSGSGRLVDTKAAGAELAGFVNDLDVVIERSSSDPTRRATRAIRQEVRHEAVGAIRSIGGIGAEMDRVATAISAAVEEQRAATGEIARSVSEAATGTRVLAAAENLSGQSVALRCAVEGFLIRMRAA